MRIGEHARASIHEMPLLPILSAMSFLSALPAPTAMAAAPPAPAAPGAGASQKPPGPRLPVAAVVERMQLNYDRARDFRARFTQKLTNATFGRTQVSTGELLWKKPGRMRWNYETPDRKMFLSASDVLWLYEPEDAQAFKQDLRGSQLPAALAFLLGKGKLAGEFDVAFAPDQTGPDYRLALKPRQPQSSYTSIAFVVDARTFLVTRSLLQDAQGNLNDVAFSDLKVNARIPDSAFAWTPPAGVKIVDTAGAPGAQGSGTTPGEPGKAMARPANKTGR